jgi:hypothetical protein
MADANTLTRIGGLLKNVYGGLETQFNTAAKTYEVFEKSTEKLGGDHFEMAARVGGNTAGIGARLSDDPTPTPSRQNIQKFQVFDRMVEGVINVYEKDVENTEGNARAFVNHLDDEIERMTVDIKWHQNNMLFGDGSGTLASVNANTSSSTSLVAKTGSTFGAFGVKYLRVGDAIDIWSSDGNTQRNSTSVVLTITAINPTTQTVTVSAAQTLTAGDIIVRNGSLNKEFQGFYLASDNSSSVTFQGLSRSTYPQIQGTVIPANGNGLSENHLQQLVTQVPARSSHEVDFIVAGDAQLNAYVGLGQGLKRYQNTNKLDRGFTELEYNGTPLRKDVFCHPQFVYGMDKATVKKGVVSPLKWSEMDGHILKKVPGFLKYEAVAREIGNWLFEVPSAVGRIDQLAVPNAINFQF